MKLWTLCLNSIPWFLQMTSNTLTKIIRGNIIEFQSNLFWIFHIEMCTPGTGNFDQSNKPKGSRIWCLPQKAFQTYVEWKFHLYYNRWRLCMDEELYTLNLNQFSFKFVCMETLIQSLFLWLFSWVSLPIKSFIFCVLHRE